MKRLDAPSWKRLYVSSQASGNIELGHIGTSVDEEGNSQEGEPHRIEDVEDIELYRQVHVQYLPAIKREGGGANSLRSPDWHNFTTPLSPIKQGPEFTDSTKSERATPAESSEPPKKKLRYVPGGPGGGGRYVDTVDGSEFLVGGTSPGGYNYMGPRGRVGRENAAASITPVVYPRRDRSTRTRTVLPRSQQPRMTFTSAAQAAATMAQNDGYKPREERGW